MSAFRHPSLVTTFGLGHGGGAISVATDLDGLVLAWVWWEGRAVVL